MSHHDADPCPSTPTTGRGATIPTNPTPAPVPTSVGRTLRLLERRWRTTGVPRTVRRDLRAEMASDLTSAHHALTAGADPDWSPSPQRLLGTDPDRFADDVALERGLPALRAQYARVLGWAGLGALVGLVVLPPVFFSYDVLGRVDEDAVAVIYGLYTAMGACFVALVTAAVAVGMRRAARVAATTTRMALLVPLSAALSLPAAIAYARATGYRTSLATVAVEVGLVLALAALAVLLARRWALRSA